MIERAVCSQCGARILWLRGATSGSLVSLNEDPVEGGNVAIKCELAHVIRGDLFEAQLDGPRYVSHISTCPKYEKHRLKK